MAKKEPIEHKNVKHDYHTHKSTNQNTGFGVSRANFVFCVLSKVS